MPAEKVIEAVIFDLGRVLVKVDFSRIRAEFADKLDSEKLDFNRITAQPWCMDFNRGRIDASQFYQQARAYVGLDISMDTFKRLWVNIFEPMPGMEELVREVARHKKVGLLSDTDAWHWNYLLERYTYLDIFSRPALSYQIGALKPNPICYERAAQVLGVPTTNCLFIDDKQENITGAIGSGMQGWVFESSDILRGQLSRTFPEMHIL